MAHFLRKGEVPHRSVHLIRPRAAVTATLSPSSPPASVCSCNGDILTVVASGICVLDRDARLAPLPSRVRVLGPEGETIEASRGKLFYVTVATLNPLHLLLEADLQDLA